MNIVFTCQRAALPLTTLFRSFTAPLDSALVFVLDNKNEVAGTSRFDDMSVKEYK